MKIQLITHVYAPLNIQANIARYFFVNTLCFITLFSGRCVDIQDGYTREHPVETDSHLERAKLCFLRTHPKADRAVLSASGGQTLPNILLSADQRTFFISVVSSVGLIIF